MAQVGLSEPELELLKLIGPRRFVAARNQATSGAVQVDLVDDDEVYGLAGRYRVMAHLAPDFIEGYCECPDADCTHLEALVLQPMLGYGPVTRNRKRIADWELALAPLLQPTAPDPTAHTQLGLQLELTMANNGATSVRMRPVLLNHTGRWVRQGISWAAMVNNWNLRQADPAQLVFLRELSQMGQAGTHMYWNQPNHYELERISNRRVWDLLTEAEDAGLTLVQTGHPAPPVLLHRNRISATAGISPIGDGLELTLTLLDDAGSAVPSDRVLLGEPAHGVAWLAHENAQPAAKAKPTLHLAALDRRLEPGTHELLRRESVTVPAAATDRFLLEYLPVLRRQVTVKADEIELPDVADPLLRLTVRHNTAERLTLTWEYVYPLGTGERVLELDALAQAWRDPELETDLTQRVLGLDLPAPMVNDSIGGRRLAPRTVLSGVTAALFVTELLPQVGELDGVETHIDVSEGMPEFRLSDAEPVVTIGSKKAKGKGNQDWFDLDLTVTVEDENVPFNELFRAIAQEEPYLLLPSGTYFPLEREEFSRLAALIAEARAMDDARRPEGSIRLSRYQAGLWEELDDIGELQGQASAWKESVLALRNATDAVPQPPPPGLKAELRPYQLAGFNWLASLHRFGLGGILADDMGLGKTLQAVALMLHVRDAEPDGAPFLVVAPTSVAGNWISEIARFAPDLTTVAITNTQTRRGADLAEAIAGADVVITTYTLLRLEQDQYCALDWAGMLLDEAQMAKNHQARTHAAARALPAPFKLAITGTPMENNLMELWSLLAITAPGLFPNATKFTEFYRTPIEKNKDAALLTQLRARVRPLMLRRTKDEVATDLPDKQEQVLSIALNPQHEKGYQLLLNRERQKILGLLGDLNGNRFEIFRSLTMLRQASLDLRLVDAEKYAKVSPTKLDELALLVEEIAREGHRTLIFSQFTRFLGAARERIEAMGIDSCYLDGKTRNRSEVVEKFRSGTAPVFLISLKAGGFGLNLTEADYVIVLDPWWNPATEAQAVDRVHRIGQTQKVMVYRLVAAGTIEEKVMALKEEKAALFSSVMDGGAFESAALTADEIRGLLAPQ